MAAEICQEKGAPIRAESAQTGIGFNMRKGAEKDSTYAIRVSEQLKAENKTQLEQTEKLAGENRASMLDEEVKAIIS